MKYLGLLCVISALLTASGCDEPADGSLASCATALQGEFDGDKSGPATALLSFEGRLVVDFEPDEEDRSFFGDADVDPETGALTAASEVMVLDGTFDFDTCDVEGTWSIASNSGTWRLFLR